MDPYISRKAQMIVEIHITVYKDVYVQLGATLLSILDVFTDRHSSNNA